MVVKWFGVVFLSACLTRNYRCFFCPAAAIYQRIFHDCGGRHGAAWRAILAVWSAFGIYSNKLNGQRKQTGNSKNRLG
jgi:hypothetical protein